MTSDGIDFNIARFLLDAQKEGRLIHSYDLIEHTLKSYSFTELLLVICELEHDKYVQFEKEFWTLTQAGIDHFFRVVEGDE